MRRKSSERENRWEWPQAGFVFSERPIASRNAVQTALQQQLKRTRPRRQPLVRPQPESGESVAFLLPSLCPARRVHPRQVTDRSGPARPGSPMR